MNKYQEALDKIKETVEMADIYYYQTACTKSLSTLQELVNNFGDFESVLDSLIKLTEENRSHAYGRDIDYYHGVLDTLLKFKEALHKKEGK